MGITNLLQTLQPCTRKINISEYSGQKVAVDAYCWLHKASYACSNDLCQGIPTNAYISYCLSFLRMMQYHKITPVVVFDGGRLPSKASTEEDRRHKRELNKSKGMEYLRAGNVTAATSCFQKGVDITPQMAYNLIKVLRDMKIEYIVAPYEADAQLAFLAVNHFVHAVVTEDSDLVAYGCPRVLFKMDKMGNGQEVKINDVFLCKSPSFINWTHQMFLHMCILCGCDFLDSLPGVGPKKAHTIVKKYRDIDKVLSALRMELALKMPPDFETAFRKAELTFLHQRVWDPAKQAVVHLTELSEEVALLDLSFLGQDIDKETGFLIANGDIDPHSRKHFENVTPVNLRKSTFSFSSPAFTAKLKAAKDMPAQKSTIPNYFLRGSSASSKPFVPPRAPKVDDKVPFQNSNSYDEDKAIPSRPASPPPTISKMDDDILAPETPPIKKRVVVSRFFGGAPGSPSTSQATHTSQPTNDFDPLNDSVDKTPTKQIGINNMKLGDSPDAPINLDNDDEAQSKSGNIPKWRGFDDAGNGNSDIRVEDDVLVYASSAKRTGATHNRAPMPRALIPQVNSNRVINSRLSLSNDRAMAANEAKRNEIQNRFGGFMQQYALGVSSPPTQPNNSPLSNDIPSNNNINNLNPAKKHSTSFFTDKYNTFSDNSSTSTYGSPALSSNLSNFSNLSTHFSSNSDSSDNNSEFHSSESTHSNQDDNDTNFVADSQEPPKKPAPTTIKHKKIFCKIDDDDDLSFPDFKSESINLHYFTQRNSPSVDSPPIAPPTNTPFTPNTSFKANSSITKLSSFSKSTSTFSASTPTTSTSLTTNTINFSTTVTPKTLPKPNLSLSSSTNQRNAEDADNANFVSDTPTRPLVVPKAIDGELSIGDSDESGDEKKHPTGTKRKIKASDLLASPDLGFLSRKLSPQNLFGRDESDDVNAAIGASKGIKKMKLEPHGSLLRHSVEDASDSPSGKKDSQTLLQDKPLGDTDVSASPSSKHTPPPPSPPPHSSSFSLGIHAKNSNTSLKSIPFSLAKADSGTDLLTSSYDFLDQFKFSGSSAAPYIPSTTRRFLTASGSPTGSPVKRINRTTSKSNFPANSFSSYPSSPSSAIVID